LFNKLKIKTLFNKLIIDAKCILLVSLSFMFALLHNYHQNLVKYVSACMFSNTHLAMFCNVCTHVIYLSNIEFSFFIGKHQSSNIFVF